MIDFAIKMTALELQWREADDQLRAARAELAVNEQEPSVVINAIGKRIERAEHAKRRIMSQIVELEDAIDAVGR